MDKYYFIYKNAVGKWNSCSNPIFIASHTYCRAIPKDTVNIVLKYDFIADLINDLNISALSTKQLQILNEFDIN